MGAGERHTVYRGIPPPSNSLVLLLNQRGGDQLNFRTTALGSLEDFYELSTPDKVVPVQINNGK